MGIASMRGLVTTPIIICVHVDCHGEQSLYRYSMVKADLRPIHTAKLTSRKALR